MVMQRTAHLVISLGSILILAGCLGNKRDTDGDVTYAQARGGLSESTAASSAASVMDGVIEISTNFTLGQAVEAAATELVGWVTSQIPCATASAEGGTVTASFGVKGSGCSYNGRTWTGTAKISVSSTTEGSVEVTHQWIGLSNGQATVDGTATVTWSATAKTRRVVHQVTWTTAPGLGGAPARSFTGTGDRTQSLLDPSLGLAGGISVQGVRTWTGSAGTWTMDIEGVEARPSDPLPQTGTYTLTGPDGASLSVTFARIDETTIRVTVSAGQIRFDFNVGKLGGVSDA